AWEFAETEKYLQAAERLCGPYVWTQYDLLVLPPSFPYGGMENPWTGNLVTNRNFEHFWLNEGFTVFLERKVNDELGSDNPFTKLVVDLKGKHPDDAFSTVFDDFLRSYLNKFAQKSLDTDQFKAYLLNYFKDNEQLKTAVSALAGRVRSAAPVSAEDVRALTPHQMIYLLQMLVDSVPLSVDRLREVGDKYKLNTSKNAEIQYRWLRLCVRSKDTARVDDVLQFVNAQGRMKYVRPLYRDLYAWEEVRARAVDNFLAHERYMMHVSAYTQWATFARTWHVFDCKWQDPYESANVIKKYLMGLHKPIYHPMNDCGDVVRLFIYPDGKIPENILENVSNQIRQLKQVPTRLDHIPEEEVQKFPKVMEYPEDYVLK
ncbi:Leukotriene A4 hydrolase, partial [Operophtera brumata]